MYKVLKPCEDSYKIAGEAIKQGKVIIVPTDAVTKLRDFRQSPQDKPLSLIIDKNEIEKHCTVKKETYKRHINILLPGKVSFLINKNGKIFETLFQTVMQFVYSGRIMRLAVYTKKAGLF